VAELLIREGVFKNLARKRANELSHKMTYDDARAFVYGHILDLRAERCTSGRFAQRLQWRVNPENGVWPTTRSVGWAQELTGNGQRARVMAVENEPPGGETMIGGDSAAEIWRAALADLEGQLTRATFDTWLRGSKLAAYEGGCFTVALANEYAVEWVENRLKKVVLRALVYHAGVDDVEVVFVVEAKKDEDS
jgi:hypothetical protein